MNKILSMRLSDVLMTHVVEKARERGIYTSNYVRMLIVQDLEYHTELK